MTCASGGEKFCWHNDCVWIHSCEEIANPHWTKGLILTPENPFYIRVHCKSACVLMRRSILPGYEAAPMTIIGMINLLMIFLNTVCSASIVSRVNTKISWFKLKGGFHPNPSQTPLCTCLQICHLNKLHLLKQIQADHPLCILPLLYFSLASLYEKWQ